MVNVEKNLSSQRVYSGRILNLRVDTVERKNGKITTREIVEHGDCVAAVALDAKENVFLVRQFRKAVGKIVLEIPAGGIESGEHPIDTVSRELQEEIGYVPGKIERLGGFYSAPGYSTEYLHLYLATELTPSQLKAEDTDAIEIVSVSLQGIPELIASGEICDAKSVAGLLRVISLRKGFLA